MCSSNGPMVMVPVAQKSIPCSAIAGSGQKLKANAAIAANTHHIILFNIEI